MFSTPKIPSLSYEVYEPAEDSFLLLDALEKEHQFLIDLDPLIILEIGSGSGIVITFIQQILKTGVYFCTDINPLACLDTLKTTTLNNTPTNIINTRFIQHTKLKGLVDLLVFNPPYVLTGEEELYSNGIKASYAGGSDGRQVIDEFLSMVEYILSPKGILYLVLINENKPKEIQRIMEERGFQSELVLYRAAGWEGLSVYKFWRSLDSQ